MTPPSRTRATKMYGLRSSIVHGRGIGKTADEAAAIYAEMEALLRAAVRTAILDPAFDDIFRTTAAVDARYSLPVDLPRFR